MSGFDWMTATVGGMWDSLLAEGKPWWITTTSDGHQGCGDWVKNPVDPLNQTGYDNIPYDSDGHTFNNTGRFPDPVNAGRPVTREQISVAVWDTEFDPENNVIDVYVSYLRSKLEANGDRPLLHTVRRVGYVLRDGEPAAAERG